MELLGASAASPWPAAARRSSAEAAENGVILLPQGARGPAFLALPNHYVIRRYNNSVSYALAIGLTADGIAGKPGPGRQPGPTTRPISREQRFGAQTALTRARLRHPAASTA